MSTEDEKKLIEKCAAKAESYKDRVFDNGRTCEFADVYDAYATGWQNCAVTAAAAIRTFADDESVLSTDEFAMLYSVRERRACVIEKSGPELDIAFRLSDLGMVAMQQLPMGVDLWITRLGRKTLEPVIGKSNAA